MCASIVTKFDLELTKYPVLVLKALPRYMFSRKKKKIPFAFWRITSDFRGSKRARVVFLFWVLHETGPKMAEKNQRYFLL